MVLPLHAASLIKLVKLSFEAFGIYPSYFRAVELFQKACDGGEAAGCSWIGEMYESGEEIKQDFQKALEWYGKACDLRDADGYKKYARLKKQLGL
jgi:TPR repeat protein